MSSLKKKSKHRIIDVGDEGWDGCSDDSDSQFAFSIARKCTDADGPSIEDDAIRCASAMTLRATTPLTSVIPSVEVGR